MNYGILRNMLPLLVIMLLVEILTTTATCPGSCDATISTTDIPISVQVIKLLEPSGNSSFTICLSPGVYNSSNGTQINFYNFSNIVIQKHPSYTDDVTIRCPVYSSRGDYNALGFFDADNILICGIVFVECGPKTSALYFQASQNVKVVNSNFHRNRNNGLGIESVLNFTLLDCTFSGNVGLQQDNSSFLIQNALYKFGGAGVGISLRNMSNSSVTIENCIFENNVAHKRLRNTDDTRSYHYIPFGNGAGIYLHMRNVKNISVKISNCQFYNNTALHQGGAIAVYILDSSHNPVEITNCTFIDNKAVGYLLSNRTNNVLDTYIGEVNANYSVERFDNFVRSVRSIPSELISQTGGVGGSLLMALYGISEFNRLCIKESTFKKNLGIGAGCVGYAVRESFSNVSNGLNSNEVLVSWCNFSENHAVLAGSAFGFISDVRIDIANRPVKILNCNFDGNVNAGDFRSSSFRFGMNGVVTTIHLPLTFLGINMFKSNVGGCINADSVKVDVHGKLEFTSNTGSVFGSAMRIVGLSLVQLFPNASIMFIQNTASYLGGALAVDNIRVEDDLALILNYNCFLQYNVGNDGEQCPSQWKANISFGDNMAAVQENSIYVKDISRCTSTPCYNKEIDSVNSTYDNSLFSLPNIFPYEKANNTLSSIKIFTTAPSNLLIGKELKPMHVFPGEQFDLVLHVLDQNNNPKIGIYTYAANAHFTEVDITEIDLTDSGTEQRFAIVDSNAKNYQRTTLVIRNSSSNYSFYHCMKNSGIVEKREFTLQLIDSSVGNVVNEITIMAALKCCRPLYEYNSIRGKCMFRQGINRKILRGDNTSMYFYIQSEKYGEFNTDGDMVMGRIPSFYQHCNSEEGLPGCLVKYDNVSHQCSEERTGFLCGQCPRLSGNKAQGLAFNLLQCVTCDGVAVLLFTLICILIVVVSILIMYYNIGLPNSLRGFMYYAQMVGYVYVSGARQGKLYWDFYLSRVFGFSFYFPLCLARMEVLQVALFGFLPPMLILMSIISYTILARKIKPLGRKKTLDGIWFLILIIYVYTFDTCFNLLRCVETEIHTNRIEPGPRVYFYDGNVTCFQNQHIPYAVISFLTLVLFVIPFPVIVVAISWNYFKKAGPFCDVVNTGIKPVYNWWSGYDLFRRVLFVAVYHVFEYANGDYTQFAMFFCAVIFLMITSRVHPYDQWRVNLVEWLILLDLVLITAYFVSIESVDGSPFGTFLFVLPYIFLMVYLTAKCISKTKPYKRLIRERVDSFVLTVSTNMGRTSTLQPAREPPQALTDLSYIDFRDELQVLTDYD